ncbi:PKD domain-containing protein [Novosphingobium beihaiensis]|uniref:PKD domain-containing protein n=1 Tax=Novosphingobium beihaiensis TaxID=2930389 RepID=A0ABT0BLG1_9SPHN|nr:PKD domain-containing protein [Novosphingobium beihaiensis]MCJ2185877.1 PKD domain-containing protein [Novosphingobium beihaiensis]
MKRLLLSAAMIGLTATATAAIASKTASPAAEQPAADPLFAHPYIDVDEWRDAPVRHRYVHGGFKGTDTRFSFYFPPKDEYQGRFFQHITPVPQSENLAQSVPPGRFNKIGFSIASGAYFVETNGGGKIDIAGGAQMADPTITAYRANAAAAQYSRVVAQQIYGGKRPYGYAYGGSGGAYRTIGSIESTHGVWDGVVPYVPGSNMAIPNMFTVRMQAMRILDKKFPQIVDAVEPGGSGDPYAGLNPMETRALRVVTKMGFPMKSWFGWKTMGVHGFAALYPGVKMADPTYFTDFWTKPGYLGHDDPHWFDGYRLQFATTVAEPITAAQAARMRLNTDASNNKDRGGVDNAFKIPEGAEGQRIVGYRLAGTPPKVEFIGGDLLIKSGPEAGKDMPVAHIDGDIVILGFAEQSVASALKPGDQVQIDNSNWLAMETYHRHQVPGPEFKVWDQFRGEDGKPLYPQRPMLIGPLFTKATSGSGMTGKFEGKMIIAASLWDREAMPWQADWYLQRAAAHFGADADNHLRLYYTDHALHGDQQSNEDPSRIVSYEGVLQQALRDLSAWVEKGVAPPASTSYRIEDGQVIVPPTAAARHGIQPVVTLAANGGVRADVAVGTPVTFTGTITVPPGTGDLVAAEWDFDGKGTFPQSSKVAKGAKSVTVTVTHTFDKPGTYFPALRGTSQRQDDFDTPYARIGNLGRVRVVVK